MGPEATLDLYREIIGLTPARRDQDHIRVLIYSNPKIPDRTRAISESGENPLPYLIESAGLLERSGAGIIAVACNTAHYFLAEMQESIGIPILDMIEETYRTARSLLPEAKTVGLLAAVGTVRGGIYGKVFGRTGVKVLVPDHADQRRVQAGILQIKARAHDRSTQDTFESVGARLMKAGAEAIILGCTEIPLAFDPNGVDYPSLNSTRILAQAAVDWARGKIGKRPQF